MLRLLFLVEYANDITYSIISEVVFVDYSKSNKVTWILFCLLLFAPFFIETYASYYWAFYQFTG